MQVTEGERMRFSAMRYCDDIVTREVGCYHCAMSFGHPYAVAYEILRNPDYYQFKAQQDALAAQRVAEGRWHDIRHITKANTPGLMVPAYDRVECFWPEGRYRASSPFPYKGSAVCPNCHQVVCAPKSVGEICT